MTRSRMASSCSRLAFSNPWAGVSRSMEHASVITIRFIRVRSLPPCHRIFSTGAIQNANTRAGDLSLIQAGCAFSHDVPPYVIAGGSPMEYGGVNTKILEIASIDKKVQKHIANAYRLLFHGKTSVFDVINQIKEQVPDSPEIQNIIQFLSDSKRGIMCK